MAGVRPKMKSLDRPYLLHTIYECSKPPLSMTFRTRDPKKLYDFAYPLMMEHYFGNASQYNWHKEAKRQNDWRLRFEHLELQEWKDALKAKLGRPPTKRSSRHGVMLKKAKAKTEKTGKRTHSSEEEADSEDRSEEEEEVKEDSRRKKQRVAISSSAPSTSTKEQAAKPKVPAAEDDPAFLSKMLGVWAEKCGFNAVLPFHKLTVGGFKNLRHEEWLGMFSESGLTQDMLDSLEIEINSARRAARLDAKADRIQAERDQLKEKYETVDAEMVERMNKARLGVDSSEEERDVEMEGNLQMDTEDQQPNTSKKAVGSTLTKPRRSRQPLNDDVEMVATGNFGFDMTKATAIMTKMDSTYDNIIEHVIIDPLMPQKALLRRATLLKPGKEPPAGGSQTISQGSKSPTPEPFDDDPFSMAVKVYDVEQFANLPQLHDEVVPTERVPLFSQLPGKMGEHPESHRVFNEVLQLLRGPTFLGAGPAQIPMVLTRQSIVRNSDGQLQMAAPDNIQALSKEAKGLYYVVKGLADVLSHLIVGEEEGDLERCTQPLRYLVYRLKTGAIGVDQVATDPWVKNSLNQLDPTEAFKGRQLQPTLKVNTIKTRSRTAAIAQQVPTPSGDGSESAATKAKPNTSGKFKGTVAEWLGNCYHWATFIGVSKT